MIDFFNILIFWLFFFLLNFGKCIGMCIIKRVDCELVSIIFILFGKLNISNGYNVVYV